MTWGFGQDRIQELIDAGELDQVADDSTLANQLIETASAHLRSAQLLLDAGDLAGAYQLAYDALRKSAAALLEAQGLRATSRGGHIAIQEALVAQFGRSLPVVKSFGRIRRARNQFEYPSESSPGPNGDDVDDAITTARRIHEGAAAVLRENVLDTW